MSSLNTDDTAPNLWRSSPRVRVEQGLLEGFADNERTWCWRGVPFAAPPVGELRWKAPRKPQPWNGVRPARRFGNPCAQLIPFVGLPMGSEDCLYLNLWRPKTDESKLPVYVYVHGGGNTIGTASYADFRGHAVASRSNMVYVSLNYRLAMFGWFRHPSLAPENSDDASGNFGTLDILAALAWIQENIEAFGGDRSCVTLSGESAGAFNILSLMLSSRAKGLFHRAIVQSGIATMQSPQVAEAAAEKVAARLLSRHPEGQNSAAPKGSSLREFLYSATTKQLLRTLDPSPMGMGMADYPTIYADGSLLPANGYGVLRDTGFVHKVPLVLGSNKDEWKLFMYMQRDSRKDLARYEALAAHRTELWRYQGVDWVAQNVVAQGESPPVYAYRFDWGSPDENDRSPLPRRLGHQLGAFHTVEVGFFLGTGINSAAPLVGWPFSAANREGRESLSAVAMRYLASFARTGDPNPADKELPHWEAWDADDRGFKALAMDVEGTQPRLTVLRYVPTRNPASTDMGLLANFQE